MSINSLLRSVLMGVSVLAVGLSYSCSTNPPANNTASSKQLPTQAVKSEALAVVEEFISLVGQNRLDDANALFAPPPAPQGTLPPGGVPDALPAPINHAANFRSLKLVMDKVVSEDLKGESSKVTVSLKHEGDQSLPVKYAFELRKLNGKWKIETYSMPGT